MSALEVVTTMRYTSRRLLYFSYFTRSAKMWPVATDISRSVVCVSVCLYGMHVCIGHTGELCRNGPIKMPFEDRLV